MHKPPWLRVRVQNSQGNLEVENLLRGQGLHTVCEEAACPNRSECFSRHTATFLIMGNQCTRTCAFCNVIKGNPQALDSEEPQRTASAVKTLGIRYAVITSVTRDDLPDKGASHFSACILEIRKQCPTAKIEVLIPDMHAEEKNLALVMHAAPDVINHNIETVPRLYPAVRPQADYGRSLKVLKIINAKNPKIITKSGIMLGMGETDEEILSVIKDIKETGCSILTIGQYLAPSSKHYPVAEYVHPDRFAFWKQTALQIGFLSAASAPLVRSSYKALEVFEDLADNQ